MGLRIRPEAAEALRAAILENLGNELFAIGDVEDGAICTIDVRCRGQADRVVALLDRPRAGQVVVHNHPSGDLTPSDADMALAGHFGQNGVGVVIVDNGVTRSNWVVEPHAPEVVHLDPETVIRVFREQLPKVIEGFEAREAQIHMARAVTEALNGGHHLVCEAGTGTGKSLAYLIPAALWARANHSRVVVSTYTRTLQMQLMDSDVPTVLRTGLDVDIRLLQGRTHYLCKRRLGYARADAKDEAETTALLEAVDAWSGTTTEGSRNALPVEVDGALWEQIRSDADITLRARCPHFANCHYYEATRRAAGAHVIVVNHALLLADLALRADNGRGVLPDYERVILDEGHHLEDAATGAASERSTFEAARQALAPLLDRPRRRGALHRLAQVAHRGTHLTPDRLELFDRIVSEVRRHAEDVLQESRDSFASLAELLPPGGAARRFTQSDHETAAWRDDLQPTLSGLAQRLDQVVEQMQLLEDVFEQPLPDHEMEPLLQVGRSRKRLVALADRMRSFLLHDPDHARWIEPAWAPKGEPATVALIRSPVEVGGVLRRLLWSPMKTVVTTSATLTVHRSFAHFRARTGLRRCEELLLPSPFDHARQALLGLPRDLPEPNDSAFLAASAEAIWKAVQVSGGGAFVLCTSYAAVRHYGLFLRERGVGPVLIQGEGERTTMLERFRSNRASVLVGTDSFWEGVSVKGDALRLVIVPRMPFRVPTDPLTQARTEAIEAAGQDPFRTYTLPDAVLKLRQGYGRLIRSRTDRGAVLLLDRRVHTRSYGPIVLRSLPPARRVKGPMRWILASMEGFFRER